MQIVKILEWFCANKTIKINIKIKVKQEFKMPRERQIEADKLDLSDLPMVTQH